MLNRSNVGGATTHNAAVPIPADLLQKVDEALTWWTKARDAARKLLSAKSQQGAGAQGLVQHLLSQTDKMFELQMKAESFKMQGFGVLLDVRDVLQKMAQNLVDIQETLRALQAMG